MVGKIEDKEKLLKLQELDNVLLDGAEEFNNSPIAKKIEETRAKKTEIKTKRDQIDVVFKKARTEIDAVSAKDSQLASEQERVQKEIDSTNGDYKKVEAFTQKLNELAGQRKQIDKKLEDLEKNFNKIQELKSKIDTAVENLSMQEDDLNSQLEASSVQLKLSMDKATEEKKKLEPTISLDALARYKKARGIVGKITIAHNDNNSCSVCRTKFSNANSSKIEEEAPISLCPNCLRVLI